MYPDPSLCRAFMPLWEVCLAAFQGSPWELGWSSRSSCWTSGAVRQGAAGSSQAWVCVCQLSLQMLYQNLEITSCIQKEKRTSYPACLKSTVPGHSWPRAVKNQGKGFSRYSLSYSLSFALWGHTIIELFRLEKTFKSIVSKIMLISLWPCPLSVAETGSKTLFCRNASVVAFLPVLVSILITFGCSLFCCCLFLKAFRRWNFFFSLSVSHILCKKTCMESVNCGSGRKGLGLVLSLVLRGCLLSEEWVICSALGRAVLFFWKWVRSGAEELANSMAMLYWKINHYKKSSRKFGIKF